MANTFHQHLYHIVFSTSGRRRLMKQAIQAELWRVIVGIARAEGWKAITVGGMEEHVHLLISIPPAIAVAKAVQVIKANSSHWMKARVRGFAWQQGYGSFTVSRSAITSVAKYIETQEKHHRGMSFEQEYLALLKRHGIEYDEKYVFD